MLYNHHKSLRILIVTALNSLSFLNPVHGIKSFILNNDSNDSKNNDTTLDAFKEKLTDFFHINGGLEGLGRAAGSTYQGYGYSDDYNYYNQQGILAQYNQLYNQNKYGSDNSYQQNYQQNNGYGHGGYGYQNYGFAQQNHYRPGHPETHYQNINQYFGGLPSPANFIRPQRYEPGFLEALTSITKHDDLRCVPRLLCEVTSAGKANTGSQSSLISFVNKDSLATLLTALNFVDDSPLMTFGRAALLGYTTRGSTRGCVQAYPTCPRDPDRLIEYLNNHNGGFFRFFQGAPSQNGPYFPRPYDHINQQYGHMNKYNIHNFPPQQNQYRILTKPAIYSSISSIQFHEPNIENYEFSISPSRKGKKLYFPDDNLKFTVAKPVTVQNLYDTDQYPYREDVTDLGHFSQRPLNRFFPDRTGTGDFILDYDQFYNQKRPYYNQNVRDHKQISFPNSNYGNNLNRRMIFPQHRTKTVE